MSCMRHTSCTRAGQRSSHTTAQTPRTKPRRPRTPAQPPPLTHVLHPRTSPPAPRTSIWVRDVHEEGIEPHPGPAVYSKNVDGLNERFGDAMYRIAQQHTKRPMLAFLLQEHHLTRLKAIEIKVVGVSAAVVVAVVVLTSRHRSRSSGRGNAQTNVERVSFEL